MIAIIDYGAGNLRSVKKVFDYLMVESQIFSNSDGLTDAEKVVLPGVGAFGAFPHGQHPHVALEPCPGRGGDTLRGHDVGSQ